MTKSTDLRAFVASLEERGELVRVTREVDPKFELAAVLHNIDKKLHKAVLFEHVKGTCLPVVSGIWGGHERVALVLGTAKEQVSRTWARMDEDLASWPDGRGPVVEGDYQEIRLTDLPMITHCGKDGGPYVTAGVALAQDPESGIGNLSYHRLQVIGPHELRLRVTPGHHLGVYHETAEKLDRPLPVAILIGAPPAVMLAGTARLPVRVDELRLAAALQGGPLPMHRCRTSDLLFPAGTEIVIEGELLPHVREPEGPFGEFMGYYTPGGRNHVLLVRGVFVRPGAIYHTIKAGSTEELILNGVSVSANVYRAVSRIVPSVIDVACWPFVFNCVVKMREEFDGQAKQALVAALGAEPTWVTMCTVVDEDTDIYDPSELIWAITTRACPDRDVTLLAGVPGLRYDPASIHWGRIGIDATVPYAHRGHFERTRVPGEEQINLRDYVA